MSSVVYVYSNNSIILSHVKDNDAVLFSFCLQYIIFIRINAVADKEIELRSK